AAGGDVVDLGEIGFSVLIPHLVEGPRFAPRPRPSAELSSGRGASPVYVPGQVTRAATEAEIERFWDGQPIGGVAIAVARRADGIREVPVGDRFTVAVPGGDPAEVIWTNHTHPRSGAIFSDRDILRFSERQFPDNAVHTVTGEKWPRANVVLRRVAGAELADDLVTTMVRQDRIINAGVVRASGFIEWMRRQVAGFWSGQ